MGAAAAQNVLAKDIMVTRLVTLRPEMDALEAIGKLLKHRISGASVVDEEGNFLGVFSEKTCMSFLLGLAYEQRPSGKVRDYMNTDMRRTIEEETNLHAIEQIFYNTEFRRLPVLRNNKLVGQISRRDVLAAALKAIDVQPREQENSLLYLSALVERDQAPVR